MNRARSAGGSGSVSAFGGSNIFDPSSPTASIAYAMAASRSGASQMPVVIGLSARRRPSGHRMSVSAQHAITPVIRVGAATARASEYAPPVDTPTATHRSTPRASSTARPSGTQPAIERSGHGVDKP